MKYNKQTKRKQRKSKSKKQLARVNYNKSSKGLLAKGRIVEGGRCFMGG